MLYGKGIMIMIVMTVLQGVKILKCLGNTLHVVET
jgi:hypothetical protein